MSRMMLLITLVLSTSALGAGSGIVRAAEGEANYFLIRYLPGESWNDSIPYADQPGLKKHHQYIQQLHAADMVVMGGSVVGEQGGLVLVRTGSMDEARALVQQDPGIKTRLLQANVTGWDVNLSSMRFVRREKMAPIRDPDQVFRVKRIDLESRLNIEDPEQTGPE